MGSHFGIFDKAGIDFKASKNQKIYEKNFFLT